MQTGELFDERYLVIKRIGQGGMSTVFLAQNIHTGSFWAIKELTDAHAGAMDLMAEPKLLKTLEHASLPRLFDIVEKGGSIFLISEYIDGLSLDRKLAEEGRLPEQLVTEWAIQLCSVLEYLHTRKPNPIIYRDMKPSNIMVTGGGLIKLIDFGIAREYKISSPADTVYIGTRGYASPEQYGSGQTSAASDLYSLGITLHHLLTGVAPWDQPSGLKPVRCLNEAVSSEMEAILLKCTMPDPAERYRTAAELKQDLLVLQQKNKKLAAGQEHGMDQDMIRASEEVGGRVPWASFRKLVVTVWDNAEFGCELAYMAAKYTGSEVLLADLDLLAPKADLFLNLKKFAQKTLKGGIYGHTGLDHVMEAHASGLLTPELLLQASAERKDLKNLHVLTGNYKLENYEYYSEDIVKALASTAYRRFDIIVLLVNRSIYDAFTLSALLHSDLNIAAIPAEVDQLREFNHYLAFLKDKQKLPADRTKFVLYEYEKATSMPLSEAREAVQGNLFGVVSFSRRRRLHRNLKGAYAIRMEKAVEREYVELLRKLGLLQPGRGSDRMGDLAGKLFRCMRVGKGILED